MAEFTTQTIDFFRNSDAGSHVLKKLDELIEVKHRDAEDNPDYARDHVQRALGVRDALKTINGLMMEANIPRKE